MTSPDNKQKLIYVCSPLSAPTRAEMLANAAKAAAYMVRAENEFGGRSVAPHAYLPYLLDDSVPEQRASWNVLASGRFRGSYFTRNAERNCSRTDSGDPHRIPAGYRRASLRTNDVIIPSNRKTMKHTALGIALLMRCPGRFCVCG